MKPLEENNLMLVISIEHKIKVNKQAVAREIEMRKKEILNETLIKLLMGTFESYIIEINLDR